MVVEEVDTVNVNAPAGQAEALFYPEQRLILRSDAGFTCTKKEDLPLLKLPSGAAGGLKVVQDMTVTKTIKYEKWAYGVHVSEFLKDDEPSVKIGDLINAVEEKSGTLPEALKEFAQPLKEALLVAKRKEENMDLDQFTRFVLATARASGFADQAQASTLKAWASEDVWKSCSENDRSANWKPYLGRAGNMQEALERVQEYAKHFRAMVMQPTGAEKTWCQLDNPLDKLVWSEWEYDPTWSFEPAPDGKRWRIWSTIVTKSYLSRGGSMDHGGRRYSMG